MQKICCNQKKVLPLRAFLFRKDKIPKKQTKNTTLKTTLYIYGKQKHFRQ